MMQILLLVMFSNECGELQIAVLPLNYLVLCLLDVCLIVTKDGGSLQVIHEHKQKFELCSMRKRG